MIDLKIINSISQIGNEDDGISALVQPDWFGWFRVINSFEFVLKYKHIFDVVFSNSLIL